MAAAKTLLSPFTDRSRAGKPAVILPKSAGDLTLSYADLHAAVEAVRAGLGQVKLAKGDVVSMSLINGFEFVAAFLGAGAHRTVAAPLNPAYKEQEVAFYLEDTQSKLVIVAAGALTADPVPAPVAAARKLGVPLAEIRFDKAAKTVSFVLEKPSQATYTIEGSGSPQESDVALVLHTSGTTGRPKAVPLSHLNLATTMGNIVQTYKLTDQDRSYLVMPLFHVHGLLAGLLAPLLSAGSIVIPPKFSATTFWSEFIAAQSTWYTAVPTIHQILLHTPVPSPLPPIRFIRSCSSALSPATFHQIEKTFQAPVLEAYAMTEAAHQMTSNPLPPAERKPGTVGLGQGVQVRILAFDRDEDVEEGEVAIKGANVTAGYINNPKANAEAFTKDGFFRTGDRGKLDSKGYLTLTGRIKELINRGGEKISPLEVDAALLAIDGVREAVAFGVPDEKYGEKVWGAVVLTPDSKLTGEQIIAAAKEKISSFKVPVRIFLLDAIPKTATGKIQRRALSTQFAKEDTPAKSKL